MDFYNIPNAQAHCIVCIYNINMLVNSFYSPKRFVTIFTALSFAQFPLLSCFRCALILCFVLHHFLSFATLVFVPIMDILCRKIGYCSVSNCLNCLYFLRFFFFFFSCSRYYFSVFIKFSSSGFFLGFSPHFVLLYCVFIPIEASSFILCFFFFVPSFMLLHS